MTIRRLLWLTLALTFVLGTSAFAQEPALSSTPDPNANISWPPPVYVLRGEFEIRGTANLPNMSNYFIEFHQLPDLPAVEGPVATEEATETEPVFFPAILPSGTPVVNDVLGAWDTTLVQDGLYEIRLVVNVSGGDPVTHTVGPLRVENEPPPFAQIDSTPQTQPTAAAPTQPPPQPSRLL